MNSIYSSKNSFITITAFYAISLPEFHMSMHTHKSCEIMYVTSGSCMVQYEGEEIRLSANEFIFLDAEVPHKLSIPKGRPCAVLNVEFLCQRKETQMNIESLWKNSEDFLNFCGKRLSAFAAEDLRNMGYALKDLVVCLQKGGSEMCLISILFQRMLLELAYCTEHMQKASGLYYLKQACSYIQERLFDTIKIPELAVYAGINKSYLQRLFSENLHCTITEYTNRKRMERAEFLLVNSSMKITDIAFSTGYNSRQHFGHTFEKYYGMSPLQYRKLHSRTLVPDTEKKQYILGDTAQIQKIRLWE